MAARRARRVQQRPLRSSTPSVAPTPPPGAPKSGQARSRIVSGDQVLSALAALPTSLAVAPIVLGDGIDDPLLLRSEAGAPGLIAGGRGPGRSTISLLRMISLPRIVSLCVSSRGREQRCKCDRNRERDLGSQRLHLREVVRTPPDCRGRPALAIKFPCKQAVHAPLPMRPRYDGDPARLRRLIRARKRSPRPCARWCRNRGSRGGRRRR